MYDLATDSVYMSGVAEADIGVCGTPSFGSYDALLIRAGLSNGSIIWCYQWGGSGSDMAAIGSQPSGAGLGGLKGLTLLPNDMLATTFSYFSPTVGPLV